MERFKDTNEKVFGNSGGKIKTLAGFVAWGGVIVFVICGILLMANGAFQSGLTVMLAGAVSSLVCALTLYGFGELIESNKEIVRLLKQANTHVIPKGAEAEPAATAPSAATRPTESKNTSAVQQPSNNPISEAAKKEAEKKERLAKGGWECTCGRVNQYFVTKCACGVSKPE